VSILGTPRVAGVPCAFSLEAVVVETSSLPSTPAPLEPIILVGLPPSAASDLLVHASSEL